MEEWNGDKTNCNNWRIYNGFVDVLEDESILHLKLSMLQEIMIQLEKNWMW